MSKKTKWLPRKEWIKQQKEKAKYAATPAERDAILKRKNKPAEFIDTIREDFLNSLSKENPLWNTEKQNSFGPVSDQTYIPFNLATGKPYKGVNWFFLSYKVWSSSPAFATFAQCKSKGWKVKKGSSAHPVIYARSAYSDTAIDNLVDKAIDKHIKKEGQADSDDIDKIKNRIVQTYTKPVFSCANVFSADDILLPPELMEVKIKPVLPEGIISFLQKNHNVKFDNALANNQAYGCYNYTEDKIMIRKPEHFSSLDHWTATALHELTHWAGHPHRTDTFKLKNKYKDSNAKTEDNAKEELTAEIGAWILCRQSGLNMKTRHTKYLKKYYDLINNDKKALTDCIKIAQKRADYLLKPVKYEFKTM